MRSQLYIFSQGSELLHALGVETHNLDPALYFVPWILFNGVSNKCSWWYHYGSMFLQNIFFAFFFHTMDYLHWVEYCWYLKLLDDIFPPFQLRNNVQNVLCNILPCCPLICVLDPIHQGLVATKFATSLPFQHWNSFSSYCIRNYFCCTT